MTCVFLAFCNPLPSRVSDHSPPPPPPPPRPRADGTTFRLGLYTPSHFHAPPTVLKEGSGEKCSSPLSPSPRREVTRPMGQSGNKMVKANGPRFMDVKCSNQKQKKVYVVIVGVVCLSGTACLPVLRARSGSSVGGAGYHRQVTIKLGFQVLDHNSPAL